MAFRIGAGLTLGLLAAWTTGAEPPICVLDLTALNHLDLADPVQARRAWDTAHAAASIQGIVNRGGPSVFLRFLPHPDDFWFEHLRQEGEWLAGREVVQLASLEDLLERFQDRIRGAVVYDEKPWAASNAASTIAGAEDRVCLRYDETEGSVYRRVMALGLPCLEDVKRITAATFVEDGRIAGTDAASTGSLKCDAYRWLKHHYLDAGRCSSKHMAYYIDAYWLDHPTLSGFSNATLTNHDFFIANRALFFDLHVWDEEAPVDDPGQAPGTDAATLRALLESMYGRADGRIFQIGGFVPWAWKYTDHGQAGSAHHPVDTEWRYAQIISAYNGIMDADALGYSGMANASFYQHHPLDAHYPQRAKPSLDALRAKGLLDSAGRVAPKVFLCFYMGDYDSAAWFNHHAPLWWRDEAHGDTLCTWAFNPNLDQRAPHAMHYVRTHATANDYFMFGDCGAGYLNPGMLIAPRPISGLPDGLDAWAAHCKPYAARYDLSITGFIIDGHAPGMGETGLDAYLEFSPDGVVGQKIPPRGLHRGRMPYLRMALDLDGSPEEAGARLAGRARRSLPQFLFVRTILKSPSWHRDVMAAAQRHNPAMTFLDPYAFFALLAEHERQRAEGRLAVEPVDHVRFTAPDQAEGLSPVWVADGVFAQGQAGGAPVLEQPRPAATQYVYFEAADAFAQTCNKPPGRTVEASVTLWDGEAGTLGIQYDAFDGDYTDGPKARLEGTGGWKTLRFTLPAARFRHGQNNGADFRLVNKALNLKIREVALSLK